MRGSVVCAASCFTGPSIHLSGNANVESLGVGTTASGTSGEIRATNNITAYYSDCRLKENVKIIESALDKVQKLNGVYFTNNSIAASFGFTNKQIQIGVIAQNIESVIPEVVTLAPFDSYYNCEGCITSISGCNYKTVYYDKIVPLLIEAIKELKCELDKLR
jgi:hypothetical protein